MVIDTWPSEISVKDLAHEMTLSNSSSVLQLKNYSIGSSVLQLDNVEGKKCMIGFVVDGMEPCSQLRIAIFLHWLTFRIDLILSLMLSSTTFTYFFEFALGGINAATLGV